MSNREHSSQLGRTLDKTKNRLTEDALTSEKKKQQRKRRPRFDRYKKTSLDLAPSGCSGCNNQSCQFYVEGLEKKVLKGNPNGCRKIKI